MRYLVALLMLAPFMILARPAGPALADHACGHFEGPEVTAAEIESAALQGCAIDALGVTVINDLSLAGVTFPQSVDFSVSKAQHISTALPSLGASTWVFRNSKVPLAS